MGFIHDTKSEIFGIETRGESAHLQDISKERDAVHIYFLRKAEIRTEIANAIMREAGTMYGKGDFKNADNYKTIADVVRQTALSPDSKPSSVEASYEWIADLVQFCTTNDSIKKHLAPFLNKENPDA